MQWHGGGRQQRARGLTTDLRASNDYRRRTFGGRADRLVAFVCECADAGCHRAVLLTADEYDRLRAAGRAILVDGSHPPPAPGPA